MAETDSCSSTTLSYFCDYLIELGWLAAIVVTPLFFNIYSERVFEPDKLALVRSIALFMLAAWLVKTVDRFAQGKTWSGEISFRRIPFALPFAALVVVYLIATVFSISPRISWLGSYPRLQGSYTFCCYVLIFAVGYSAMRSTEQVRRAVTAVIVTSVPVALYGLLQYFGLDPLLWGKHFARRISGQMGNPIFVAAYLIMAVPLTLNRIIDCSASILKKDEHSGVDFIRAALYAVSLLLQLSAIILTSSRGPFIGLLIGLFVFGLIFLVLLRKASQQRLGCSGVLWALLLTSPVSIALFASAYLRLQSSAMTSLAFFVCVIGGVIVAQGILIACRNCWRWLWLSWVFLALMLGAWFVLFNASSTLADFTAKRPVLDEVVSTMNAWRRLPSIGRLGRVLESHSGTGRIRLLIWRGTVDLLSPHEPLQTPAGKKDPYNVLRPLIGYGPESMFVAYNRFFPPKLAGVDSRRQSPDRTHNETFDAVVITGFLGLGAWQLLYLIIFYQALRCIGFAGRRHSFGLFAGLWIGGGLLCIGLLGRWMGMEFIGVALPLGNICALVLYLGCVGVKSGPDQNFSLEGMLSWDRLLIIALISALVAHYIEINFGIAIAATRVHFFVYLLLLAALGSIGSREAQAEGVKDTGLETHAEPQGQGWARDKRFRVLGPSLIWSVVAALILVVLGYDFITYLSPPGELIRTIQQVPTVHQVLDHSFFLNRSKGYVASPFIFLLILFSWLFAVLVGLCETVRSCSTAPGTARNGLQSISRLSSSLLPLAVMALVSLVTGALFMYLEATAVRQALLVPLGIAGPEQQRLQEAEQYAQTLSLLYLFVFGSLVIFAAAIVLSKTLVSSPAGSWGTKRGFLTLILTALIAFTLIKESNLEVIQADMIYKRGKPFAAMAQKAAAKNRQQAIKLWEIAGELYRRTIALVPKQDFYYLALTRAYMGKSTLLPRDSREVNEIIRTAKTKLLTAQELNPLNADYAANLARLSAHWARVTRDAQTRRTEFNNAVAYYQDTISLTPNHGDVRNEYAALHFSFGQDCKKAIELYFESLAADPYFAGTYFEMAELYLVCGAKEPEREREHYYELAETALREGKKHLDRRVVNKTRAVQNWMHIAKYYERSDELDKAFRAYGDARELATKKVPRWNISYLMAKLSAKMGNVGQAIALGQEALQEAPQDAVQEIEQFFKKLPRGHS